MASGRSLPLREGIRDEGKAMTEFPPEFADAVFKSFAAHHLLGRWLLPPAYHLCCPVFTWLGCLPPSSNLLERLSIWIS
jgi:hypothetical protein